MFLFKVLFFDIKGSMLHEILKKKKNHFLPVQSTQNLPVPWSFTIFFIKAKPKSNPLPREKKRHDTTLHTYNCNMYLPLCVRNVGNH